MSNIACTAIAQQIGLRAHDFNRGPLVFTADQIKAATHHLTKTSEKEPRLLGHHVLLRAGVPRSLNLKR